MTPAESFTLIDDGQPLEVRARIAGGRVRLSGEALRAALGLEVTPQGICAGRVCTPVDNMAALVAEDGIDLAACAEALGRPLALDVHARAAYLGVAAADRGRTLASLEAPDFTLPDLAGRLHSLSDHRGKKVLLIAHASW
jgi:hypothetical protein